MNADMKGNWLMEDLIDDCLNGSVPYMVRPMG